MLRITVSQLRAGMTIAAPIAHPLQPGIILLNRGVTLDEAILGRLRDTGVREVWIRYPGLEELSTLSRPGVGHAAGEVARLVNTTFSASTSSVSARLDYPQYRAAVVGLLEKLADSPRAAVFLDEMAGVGCASVRHASAVAFISLLIGLRLEPWLIRHRAKIGTRRAKEIANLGIGALLHDVGMMRLSRDARARWAATGDETDAEFQAHCTLGHEMVHGEVEPTAAAVVLHHHQRYDGSGFPIVPWFGAGERPLFGDRIHPFASIVGVVDVYDRLRFGIDDVLLHAGTPTPTVRVLKTLLEEPWRSRLDPVVRMGLLAVVPPFAPGTVVGLSDGRAAAVLDWSPLDPCRPVVQDLAPRRTTKNGWACDEPGERIDLRERRDLSVVRAEGADVSGDSFGPVTAREFDLDAMMRSWTERLDLPGQEGTRLTA